MYLVGAGLGVVELEQFMPTTHDQPPYLRTTDGDPTTFEEAAADDPTVDRRSLVPNVIP